MVCEEVFAPVVTIIPYETFDEALALANDSPYGLQAGLFTRGWAEGVDGAIICEPEENQICAAQKGALRIRVDCSRSTPCC